MVWRLLELALTVDLHGIPIGSLDLIIISFLWLCIYFTGVYVIISVGRERIVWQGSLSVLEHSLFA